MSEAGAGQWEEEPVDLAEERAELLPERTTLATVDVGRKEFYPSNVAVDNATSDNIPVGSPASNNAIVSNASAPEISGGYMPVVITLMPSINFVFQGSDMNSADVGHHGDGHADDAPLAAGHADSRYAGGNGWWDFWRRLFGG